MKVIIPIESIGLLLITCTGYAHLYPQSWSFFALIFFAPDLSFIAYMISIKWGAYLYNVVHHQGLIALTICIAWWSNHATGVQVGLVFLAHSFFDRIWGYGLKYPESFHHTHLGWIGKEKAQQR